MNSTLKSLYEKRAELISKGHCAIFSKEVNDIEDQIFNTDNDLNITFDEIMDKISKGQLKSVHGV